MGLANQVHDHLQQGLVVKAALGQVVVRASIEAALNPAANPSLGDPICVGLPKGDPCVYMYYVLADEDGRHVFSATLEQQEANIEIARAKGLL